MKRSEQLQKLSREHHGSLRMAQKILRAVEEATGQVKQSVLEDLIDNVKHYYDSELEIHFQHEERTIFTPLFQQFNVPEHKASIELATVLLKEHGFIRLLVPKMGLVRGTLSATKDLSDFARVLKDHTQKEERELFPRVEALFSEEQLDAIIHFKPLA